MDTEIKIATRASPLAIKQCGIAAFSSNPCRALEAEASINTKAISTNHP